MVECTALEMRHTCKGIVGSNPTLSAIWTWAVRPPNDLMISFDIRCRCRHWLGHTLGTPFLSDFLKGAAGTIRRLH